MRRFTLLGLGAALCLCSAQVNAAVLFSDGFETYNPGQLATTDANTTNPGPNGGPGNPWWAPFSGNGLITGAVNGVTPHSGTQMLMGAAPGDFDQNVVNIAHRFGGNAPITGNIALDFYFYDTNGAGDATNTGYAEVGYYDGVPSNTDYNANHSLSFTTNIQRLVLGMVGNNGGNLNVYQARLLGGTPTIGTSYASTYINTTTPRTVGWHEGRIVIGPQLQTGGNLVDFYIDNMTTPTAEATTSEAFGYNVVVLNTQEASSASTINYFDDLTLSSVPEPASLSVLALSAFGLLRRRRS